MNYENGMKVKKKINKNNNSLSITEKNSKHVYTYKNLIFVKKVRFVIV